MMTISSMTIFYRVEDDESEYFTKNDLILILKIVDKNDLKNYVAYENTNIKDTEALIYEIYNFGKNKKYLVWPNAVNINNLWAGELELVI